MIDTAAERMDVGGVRLEVVTRGDGAPLLFLHPGDGIESSLPFIDALARHFKVVAPSHPGFGGTELPDEIDSVDDLSYFYLDVLERLGGRAILAGASFGGWIAAEIATKCQTHISHLALIGSVGIKAGSRTERPITDIFSIPLAELPGYLSATVPAPDYGVLTDAALTRIARNRESLSLFGWAPTLHDPKLRSRLRRVRVPTLCLWGDGDRVVTPDYGRAFAEAIPNARFEVLGPSGHYVHLDQTARTVTQIVDFVRSAREGDAR